MPFVDNTIEVQHIQSLNTIPWAMSRYYYTYANPVDQVTADTIAGEFALNYATYIAPRTRNIISSDYIRVRNNSAPGFPWFSSQTDETNSSTGGLSLPLQTCLVVSLVSNLGGTIGRTYLWGFDANQLTATGFPTTAVVQAALDYVDNLRLVAAGGPSTASMAVIRNTGSASVPVYVAAPVTGVMRTPASEAAGWQVQTRRRNGLELLT